MILLGALVVGGSVMNRGREWTNDVRVYSNPGGIHVEIPVNYQVSPPVGGPHNPVWQNCGIYRDELLAEHVVHSLEHGAVWVTYNPDLVTLDEISDLEQRSAGRNHLILSPYRAQEPPIVLTAWDRQLDIDDAASSVIEEFLDTYTLGLQSPEPGARCDGGTSVTLADAGQGGGIGQNTGNGANSGLDAGRIGELIGMSEQEAATEAARQGWTWRVTVREGEALSVTMDYREDRLNASIENGIVTEVSVG
jgi:hypothetical protein